MPIYRGTYFELPLQLLMRANSNPLNISTWEFRTEFRNSRDDADVALEATTSGGQWVVSDGVNGKLRLVMTPEETAALELGTLVGDLMRTDSSAGRIPLIAEMRIPVLDPITRT